MTYLQAIVIGLLQGVSELFPVSSLGHAILLPALAGRSWATNLNLTAPDSPYLAFLVAVHVATAIALVVFFRHDWARILTALYTSIRDRRIRTDDQKLAWILITATIPVGLAGLALEHTIRTVLGKPVYAAVFLILNGLLLATVERLRQRTPEQAAPAATARPVAVSVGTTGRPGQVYASTQSISGHISAHGSDQAADLASDRRIAALTWRQAISIGAAQILALLPGISRSGATIAAGLLNRLNHTDAARFAFLLATPVIAAAGVLKLPELATPANRGVLGPALVGSIVAGLAAYLALRFLTRYFETRTLNPFAIYCIAAGTISLIWLTLH